MSQYVQSQATDSPGAYARLAGAGVFVAVSAVVLAPIAVTAITSGPMAAVIKGLDNVSGATTGVIATELARRFVVQQKARAGRRKKAVRVTEDEIAAWLKSEIPQLLRDPRTAKQVRVLLLAELHASPERTAEALSRHEPGELAECLDYLVEFDPPAAEALRAARKGPRGAVRKGGRPVVVRQPRSSVGQRMLRLGEGRALSQLRQAVDAVHAIESDYVDLSDAELRELTDQFQQRLTGGESLDKLLPEAFATAREASYRVLGQRHFDVQVMGGAGLHLGGVVQMRTGEGKTLTSVLPAYLNALTGRGVHVVTTNDYLARRDAEAMGQVHRFLGLSVGLVSAEPTSGQAEAYGADITYGTSAQFGFSYLRDNMASSYEDLVQRGHFFAIVDEVDSILIDEARIPLIISGPVELSTRLYGEFATLVARLRSGKDGEGDYEVDHVNRTVAVTERGEARVEDRLGVDSLYESANRPLIGYLHNAIKAKELYKRDRDYIVSDGEVLIVDEFTGRILHGRRYNEGMHQAIEAKEGVEIKQENQTLATITLQNYFRMYEKLSGMTGTGRDVAGEFHRVYDLDLVEIPTRRPMIRTDHPDVVYRTQKAKLTAVVADIAERHTLGQPVLVGTVSVENSEFLSQLLRRRGIPHSVLNAKLHAKEAEIIAQAGRKGAVTVATNMAGRGTDILLGGNPEFLAASELRQRGLDPGTDPVEYAWVMKEVLPRWKEVCDADAEEVTDAGGLYVLGTERHHSRRVDDQLRGRAGRQGDPGESRFYLSLDDPLARHARLNPGEVDTQPPDAPVRSSRSVSRRFAEAQDSRDAEHAEQRRTLLRLDEVLDTQRQVVYAERRRVLVGEDMHQQILQMLDDTLGAWVDQSIAVDTSGVGVAEQLWQRMLSLYRFDATFEEFRGEVQDLDRDQLVTFLIDDARRALERRYAERELDYQGTRELERLILLSVIDHRWREHLADLDGVREGIGLRSYARHDPVVEFEREARAMFEEMLDSIKEDVVGFVFNLEVTVVHEVPSDPAVDTVEALGPPPAPAPPRWLRQVMSPLSAALGALFGRALSTDQSQPQSRVPRLPTPTERPRPGPVTPGQQVGSGSTRNAPCPCGSGKKYKRCHGAPR